MYLADLAKGRDNNLTLLRAVAAIAVLVSHSYVLTTGSPASEPLRTWIGMTPGSIAVDVFFVLSGFLVTASICKSRDVLDFAIARCLRIFPALLIVLLITIFVVGPIITTVPLSQYFSRTTLAYFLKCATLVLGVSYELPGMFGGNPYPRAVNGSLWTMPWEIRSYVVLVCVWWLSTFIKKGSGRAFLAFVALIACSLFGLLQYLHWKNAPSVHSAMPLLMFALGAVAWQTRTKISLSWRGFAVALVLMGATAGISVNALYVAYPVAMAYAVMFLAFVPGGVVRQYNRMGDYSYGLYLYAFPIQQLLAMAWPGITVGQMIGSSLACTLLFAVLSWHVVEERALAMKARVVAYLRAYWPKFQGR